MERSKAEDRNGESRHKQQHTEGTVRQDSSSVKDGRRFKDGIGIKKHICIEGHIRNEGHSFEDFPFEDFPFKGKCNDRKQDAGADIQKTAGEHFSHCIRHSKQKP